MTEQLQTLTYVSNRAGLWVQATVANEESDNDAELFAKIFSNCQKMMAKDPKWTWARPFKGISRIRDGQVDPYDLMHHLEDDHLERIRLWVPDFGKFPTKRNLEALRRALETTCGINPRIVPDMTWGSILAHLGGVDPQPLFSYTDIRKTINIETATISRIIRKTEGKIQPTRRGEHGRKFTVGEVQVMRDTYGKNPDKWNKLIKGCPKSQQRETDEIDISVSKST